jgi:precorrin-2 dehydrogenase/sirohydrochlorin ferrochelatase
MSDFPEISPGGSLLLAWQLRGRRVLIVGGGQVASDRIRSVLTADAKVTLVCPSSGLCAEVRHRLENEPHWAIVHHDRSFRDSDLDDPDLHMVLTAIDDPAASTHIYTLAHQKRININVADVPPEVRSRDSPFAQPSHPVRRPTSGSARSSNAARCRSWSLRAAKAHGSPIGSAG